MEALSYLIYLVSLNTSQEMNESNSIVHLGFDIQKNVNSRQSCIVSASLFELSKTVTH